jgi:uncharacterized protein (TIGR02147 family)
MVFEHRDYREFLKTTLTEKASSREGYSLRAFAQKVGVSSSFLSEVLNAKKSLSVELAFKIAVKLDLTETETQYLCVLVQLEQEQDPEFREVLVKRLQRLNPNRITHDLSADLFKSIADWHHYAILEMTYLSGVRLESALIAKKLGISKIEAELALDRLVRLELLEKNAKTGRYAKAHSYVLAQSQIPNGALKQFHQQILEKAIESLKTQSPDERMSATDVIPIDSRHLAKVDRLSREFSAAVLKLSEESKVKDSVYALSVHFFNVMKK